MFPVTECKRVRVHVVWFTIFQIKENTVYKHNSVTMVDNNAKTYHTAFTI